MEKKTTKETLKFIVKNWKTMTKEDICAHIKQSEGNLNHLVWLLRKAGFDMPKKRYRSYLSILLEDFAKEEGVSK